MSKHSKVKVKTKPKKPKKSDFLMRQKEAGTTMFKKQHLVKTPFYEPVNLKHYYDTAKIYDSKKEPDPISEEIF
jgi:hypothetical protein